VTTRSIPQATLSRRDLIKAAASLPIAAALAPITPAKAEALRVEPWHVDPDVPLLVVDASGNVIACALRPEIAQAIAQGGGYTLPKPAGEPGTTLVAWDDASRETMASAWPCDSATWPLEQVDAIEAGYRKRELFCESSDFDGDAERRRAVMMTVTEWANERATAYMDAAIDALTSLLPAGSLEARLLGRVADAAYDAILGGMAHAATVAQVMGDKAPGEDLLAEARALRAKL